MNDLLYLGGFCLIHAIFLFPDKVPLNAATSMSVPFAHFPDVPRFRRYRTGLACLSIATCAFLLFAVELARVALILGSLPLAAYGAPD